jgi:prefoldin alpha subunit
MFGEIREVQKVMVDVGTGYFVEKELDDAIKFFEKKVALVADQLEKLQQIIQAKRNDVAKIRAAMQSRINAMNRAQQAQQSR